MTTSVTDDRQAFEKWAWDQEYDLDTFTESGEYVETETSHAWLAWRAALRSQVKVDHVTVCCSRRECGGECGNEWQGMRSVRRSGEDTIMAIMGADNMDHAIRILDEYANLTAIIGEGD